MLESFCNNIFELWEDSEGMLSAYNDEDEALFQHCTNGSNKITYSGFQHYKPIFCVHGKQIFKRFKFVNGVRESDFIG